MRVLEPSAGTGALLRAIEETCSPALVESLTVHIVEVNPTLAAALAKSFPRATVFCQDFLSFEPDQAYDRILMNPPFAM
jgi:tRNA1(Val) A37 N6-methylase TrmN6